MPDHQIIYTGLELDQQLAKADHDNRTALDAVQGVNTGDQDLSGKEDVGVAAGLVGTHESTYDHTVIADLEPLVPKLQLEDGQLISFDDQGPSVDFGSDTEDDDVSILWKEVRTLDQFYAQIAGDENQLFSVADATAGKQAVNYDVLGSYVSTNLAERSAVTFDNWLMRTYQALTDELFYYFDNGVFTIPNPQKLWAGDYDYKTIILLSDGKVIHGNILVSDLGATIGGTITNAVYLRGRFYFIVNDQLWVTGVGGTTASQIVGTATDPLLNKLIASDEDRSDPIIFRYGNNTTTIEEISSFYVSLTATWTSSQNVESIVYYTELSMYYLALADGNVYETQDFITFSLKLDDPYYPITRLQILYAIGYSNVFLYAAGTSTSYVIDLPDFSVVLSYPSGCTANSLYRIRPKVALVVFPEQSTGDDFVMYVGKQGDKGLAGQSFAIILPGSQKIQPRIITISGGPTAHECFYLQTQSRFLCLEYGTNFPRFTGIF